MTERNLDIFDDATSDMLITALKDRTLKLTDEEFKGITLCILLQFQLEKMFKDVVVKTLNKGMIPDFFRPDIFEFIYEKLTFLNKIQIAEKILSTAPEQLEKYKDFLSYCKLYNEHIRNNLYHSKLDKVNYKGGSLSIIENQRALVKDMFIATSLFAKAR